ncbi:hypothetical protein OH76DRAFT_362773 [Lentinus brumalis]|uniref:Uncharacterized protein n=1 Tax=Lentinus brumalis TaxID=2498619 RepID=A0A371DEA3_9APHY|nr:hypothetical protein OH76DRAFT_362773 [Polyporus brumalis]
MIARHPSLHKHQRLCTTAKGPRRRVPAVRPSHQCRQVLGSPFNSSQNRAPAAVGQEHKISVQSTSIPSSERDIRETIASMSTQ